jgi:hypothetical protein
MSVFIRDRDRFGNKKKRFFIGIFEKKNVFFLLTRNHSHFVNINMPQQNINLDKLLTKGLFWGPPLSFVAALLRKMFVVAPSQNPYSEAYQN